MLKIKERNEKLEEIIERYMEEEDIPGVAIGIVMDSKIAYTKGFGVMDISTGEKVNENTLFHMASISKTFVATAIMQLVENGKMDINKLVIEYVPYFKLEDERYKKVTVKYMLTHLSGMPDVENYEWDKPKYGDDALEGYVRSISDKKLMWNPGEKFAYSNIAYEILGDVIAKASGMSFEDYIKENILNPLGMMESTFLNEKVSRVLLTTPHVRDSRFEKTISEIFPYNRIHSPSSTLYSNVTEMCNYAITYMNKGNFNGKQIFTRKSYEAMTMPYAEAGRGELNIGLSWFIKDYHGAVRISHSGGDTGFRSNLIILPEKGMAVVGMSNCDYGNVEMITEAALDIINGYEVKNIKISPTPLLYNILVNHGIESVREKLRDMKENELEKYHMNEWRLNSLAYGLMGSNRINDGIEILKLAIEEYPNSANLYDSLGELYLKKGDKRLSVDSYKKSLELNLGNSHAKEMVERLEKEIHGMMRY